MDCLCKAGFEGPWEVEGADGLVPIGATVLPATAFPFSPPGDELLVRLVCSSGPLLPGGLEAGLALLLARSRGPADMGSFGGSGPDSYVKGEAPRMLEGPP